MYDFNSSDLLADYSILAGEFQAGDTAVVDANEECYTFEKKRPEGRPSGREKVAVSAGG